MKDLSFHQQQLAELVIRRGVNLQKGQRLAISAPVECADFVRLCAQKAYEAGCGEVITLWEDDALTKMKYLYASDETFDRVNPWDKLLRDTVAEEGIAWLAIYAEDPQNLKDADPDRIARWQKARGKAFESFYQHETRNDFPWCVVSVPTRAWARAVFPECSEEDAVGKLWEEILRACRCDGEDALKAWDEHSRELQTNVKKMNGHAFRALHYKNSLGTDLWAELPEGHFWAGGEEKCALGTNFSANIPTEEIFTLPKKTGVHGVVKASRPLCLNGNVVEDFSFEVREGKIVGVHAEKGEAILRDALAVDEGASYFGELALVPYDSPICASGVLFYNTLFDENASCHIAFGEAYPCLKGAESMTPDELAARGVNASVMHEDFMIGTRDLSVTGITADGREIPVMRDGKFVL